jgi:hypothetical protein
MWHSQPYWEVDEPEESPYAPPRAEIKPEVDKKEPDQAEIQRKNHLLRESCVRITGLLCLILAIIVFLSFGFGTLSELLQRKAPGEPGIEPWMHRRWIARMTSVLALAVIAAVTSWGVFRLKNWGRWGLTAVTMLPVPPLIWGWLFLHRIAGRGFPETLEPKGLVALSVMSALSCPPLLFLLWSPKGKTVFSPEYRELIRQTPDLRPGCWGALPALVTALAGFISYFVLLLTGLMILTVLEVIRSV